MSSRRRMLMGTGFRFYPDPEIPDAWQAVETITDTWAQVVYHAQVVGDYKTRYKVGDTKVADFGPNGRVLMEIGGFNLDPLSDGSGKASITWIGRHVLPDSCLWDSSGTVSATGYESSDIYKRVNDLIFDAGKALLKGIREVNKTCYVNNNDPNHIVPSKIWIPSYREINGQSTTESLNHEKSGPIYKKLIGASGLYLGCPITQDSPNTKNSYAYVWERSVRRGQTNKVMAFNGVATISVYPNDPDFGGHYILPCFCV